MLGEGSPIVRLRDLIARIGPTDAGVLIRGAAGTGKSLAARLMHQASNRTERLIVEGSRVGDAAFLPGTTVVIEDVEDVPRGEQRMLAERLDGVRAMATSRLTRSAMRDRLVDDLLYRINTIEIDLPALIDRDGDALSLATHFLAVFAARHGHPSRMLSAEAARSIAADRWPDNVRGLRQACERAVLLGTGDHYEIAEFKLSVGVDRPVPRAASADLNLGRGEKTLVAGALQRHAFNVSRAAAELGLTRAALYRRMEKHGL